MNPKSNMTYAEATTEDTAARGQIEDGLERLFHQHERVERAFAVLADRLSSVLQPQEPTDPACLDGDAKGMPRSPVANRIHATADDLARFARHIESVTDRLDT